VGAVLSLKITFRSLPSFHFDSNDRDQGKLRNLLRRYHAISPWNVGTDITSWIMARHEEVKNVSEKRSRSVSQQPPQAENAIEPGESPFFLRNLSFLAGALATQSHFPHIELRFTLNH
jgi:hypothetical protein